MDLSREHFRAMIYYDFRRGLSAQKCIQQLTSAFGDAAPHRATVFRWFNGFNRGRASLADDLKAGRPNSAVVPKNINAVRELMKEERHVTYRDIQASLGISMSSIHTILHDHLVDEKIDALPEERDDNKKADLEQKQEAQSPYEMPEAVTEETTKEELKNEDLTSEAVVTQRNATSFKAEVDSATNSPTRKRRKSKPQVLKGRCTKVESVAVDPLAADEASKNTTRIRRKK